MCVAGRNGEKFTRKPSFGGSRSFKVIDVKKSKKPVLVIMCSMSVGLPICNSFHIKQANSGKITSFGGYSYLTPSFEGYPFTEGHEILSRWTSVLGAANSEDFIILGAAVLIQCQGVTDERTDRQTPRRWLRCAKHYMLSRVKTLRNCWRSCNEGASSSLYTTQ